MYVVNITELKPPEGRTLLEFNIPAFSARLSALLGKYKYKNIYIPYLMAKHGLVFPQLDGVWF